MQNKSHSFSQLSQSEFEAIVAVAKQLRSEAIGSGFAWLGRTIAKLLSRALGATKAPRPGTVRIQPHGTLAR